jgi:hypothetical protein
MEKADAEEYSGGEGDQDSRITAAPLLSGEDQIHPGESCGSGKAPSNKYRPPLFRH